LTFLSKEDKKSLIETITTHSPSSSSSHSPSLSVPTAGEKGRGNTPSSSSSDHSSSSQKKKRKQNDDDGMNEEGREEKNGRGEKEVVSEFDRKTDETSSSQYFYYYGCVIHQQNMLQDSVRTSTYQRAFLENPKDFEQKVVLDVGCGSGLHPSISSSSSSSSTASRSRYSSASLSVTSDSLIPFSGTSPVSFVLLTPAPPFISPGILSFFALQAGASKVYGIEASRMANHARLLSEQNRLSTPHSPSTSSSRFQVIFGKVEEVEVPEKVDVIISEPMGTLLLNERMIESYIYARKKVTEPFLPYLPSPDPDLLDNQTKWLKEGGKMFPSKGAIFVAPFSDHALFFETTSKAAFWAQQSFYGVDLSALHNEAKVGVIPLLPLPSRVCLYLLVLGIFLFTFVFTSSPSFPDAHLFFPSLFQNEYFSQPVVDYIDPSILVGTPVVHQIDFMTCDEKDLERVEIELEFHILTPGMLHGVACWFDVLFEGSRSKVRNPPPYFLFSLTLSHLHFSHTPAAPLLFILFLP
jgi:hypothetical protein